MPTQTGLCMSEEGRYFVLFGLTESGNPFRPSDWAERLAGVMAPYRPPNMPASYITYSPYVMPKVIHGIRCVVVDDRLRELEPLAWKFVHDFAKDNALQTREGSMQDIQSESSMPIAKTPTRSA